MAIPLHDPVEKAHLEIDGRIEAYLNRHSLEVSCKRGCFSCCFALVVLSLGEADSIRAQLEPGLLAQVETTGLQRLQRIARDKNQPDFATQYFLEAHRCPFLSPDNACSVHPFRPLACRGVLTDLEPIYCAPGVGPNLKGSEKIKYQVQLRPYHGPEHYLKTPWQVSERLAHKLWETERQVRGFTVIGEMASLIYLLGQAEFQGALEAGKKTVSNYLRKLGVLGGGWGFWVG